MERVKGVRRSVEYLLMMAVDDARAMKGREGKTRIGVLTVGFYSDSLWRRFGRFGLGIKLG